MVNLRATFDRARDMSLLSLTEAQRLTDSAKSLHFPDRTVANILASAALPDGRGEVVRDALASNYVDLKAQDARQLLSIIISSETSRTTLASFEPTPGFERLYNNDRMVRHAGLETSLRGIATHVALHRPDHNNLVFSAMNRELAQVLARELGIEPTDEEVLDAELRFLRRWRLVGAERDRWRQANDLSESEFRELMYEIATCRRLHRWLLGSPRAVHRTKWVLDELRLQNTYTDSAHAAVLQAASAAKPGSSLDSASDLDDAALSQLLGEHQSETGWTMYAPIETWMAESGFTNHKDLADALLQARRARQTQRDLQTSPAAAGVTVKEARRTDAR
jgi:hypothetical protein